MTQTLQTLTSFGDLKAMFARGEHTKSVVLRENTLEWHYHRARMSLAEDRDLPSGFEHLGAAIAAAPHRRDLVELADEFIRRAPPAALLRRAQRTVAQKIVRAFSLAHSGMLTVALETLVQMEQAGEGKGLTRYLALRWCEEGDFSAYASETLACVRQAAPAYHAATAVERAIDRRWAKLVQDPSIAPDDGARALAEAGSDATSQGGPYASFIPVPDGELVRAIQELMERNASGEAIPETFGIHLSDPPAPSHYMALQCALDIGLDFSFRRIPRPDPRWAATPAPHRVWWFDRGRVVPALSAPSAEVAERIRRIAERPFHAHDWWVEASLLAKAFAPEQAAEILACMCHPLSMPDAMPQEHAFEWVLRVQLATTFIVAHLAPDQPWEQSARRDALLSALHTPIDWGQSAAIVALARVARGDACARVDVHKNFVSLLVSQPDGGDVPWLATLYREWASVPGLTRGEEEGLRERLASWGKVPEPSGTVVSADDLRRDPHKYDGMRVRFRDIVTIRFEGMNAAGAWWRVQGEQPPPGTYLADLEGLWSSKPEEQYGHMGGYAAEFVGRAALVRASPVLSADPHALLALPKTEPRAMTATLQCMRSGWYWNDVPVERLGTDCRLKHDQAPCAQTARLVGFHAHGRLYLLDYEFEGGPTPLVPTRVDVNELASLPPSAFFETDADLRWGGLYGVQNEGRPPLFRWPLLGDYELVIPEVLHSRSLSVSPFAIPTGDTPGMAELQTALKDGPRRVRIVGELHSMAGEKPRIWATSLTLR